MPSTPNVEKGPDDMNYGAYEHVEPNTPDSEMANEALLKRIGHVAPDTPVSLGFQYKAGSSRRHRKTH